MTKKELAKTIKEDVKDLKEYDKDRDEENRLERIEGMNFDSTDNAVFDYGMMVAYTNILERITISDKEYRKM